MWGRYSSQDLWFPLSKTLSNVERDLLTTSVCPSVCGWQEVEKQSFVPSLDHKVLRKWLRNLASLSDTIVLGKQWRRITSLKNNLAILLASSTLWHGIKCAILETIQTTSAMVLYFPFHMGSKEFLFKHGQSFGYPKVTHKSPLMHFFDQKFSMRT